MATYSTLRIIAGTDKGKKLNILPNDGLRPTPDRVREDMFILLGSKVEGALVLDLFAGSGVLGLEALSRGAKKVFLIEKDRNNYLNLCNEKQSFKEQSQIEVINADALNFLDNCKQQFDLIFLDPPYQSELLTQSLEKIIKLDILAPNGLIYAERPSGRNEIFKGYEIKEKRTIGQVSFAILKKSSFLF